MRVDHRAVRKGPVCPAGDGRFPCEEIVLNVPLATRPHKNMRGGTMLARFTVPRQGILVLSWLTLLLSITNLT